MFQLPHLKEEVILDALVTYPLDLNFNSAVVAICAHYVPVFIIADHAPGTYKQLKTHLDSGATLVVAHDGSNSTIFASPSVNFAFRAWHDWCHWNGDFDFSLYGESATCCLQISQMYSFYGVTPNTNRWAQYLTAEIVGQRRYYEKYREYIYDQRAFCDAYLADQVKSLDKKW